MNHSIQNANCLKFLGLVPAIILLLSFCQKVSAQISQIRAYPLKEIAHASGDSIMHFPSAIAFDVPDSAGEITKKLLVSWAVNKDDASLSPSSGRKISYNGGLSFGKVSSEPNVGLVNARKLIDGRILSLPFKTDDRPGPGPKFSFSYHVSSDNGETWTKYSNGIIDFGKVVVNGLRLHRGILEGKGGTLYSLGYGGFAGDKVSRVFMLRSEDGGMTWTYHSTVAHDPVITFNEAVVAQCADGTWLAVMRNESWKPLYFARSSDQGATWTRPALLPGLPTTSTTGDDLNESVDPDLLLMPNGILVLSYGRPNVHLAFSTDGNGLNWTNITTTFVEVQNVLETSSYTNILPIEAHRLFLIHDGGANWSYPKSYLNSHPNPYSILGGYVDIIRTEANRIDLKKLYKEGKIKMKTDMTYVNPKAPEARITGAFDGSTDYWSSAFKAGSKASFVIELDREYLLTDLAVSLQQGVPQSAIIRFSRDGKNWKEQIDYKSKTHYTMEYKKLQKPLAVRYVQVDLAGNTQLVSLNEIELYGSPRK